MRRRPIDKFHNRRALSLLLRPVTALLLLLLLFIFLLLLPSLFSANCIGHHPEGRHPENGLASPASRGRGDRSPEFQTSEDVSSETGQDTSSQGTTEPGFPNTSPAKHTRAPGEAHLKPATMTMPQARRAGASQVKLYQSPGFRGCLKRNGREHLATSMWETRVGRAPQTKRPTSPAVRASRSEAEVGPRRNNRPNT